MGELPSFEHFYAAVNRGRKPFPWQSRLAERVAKHGWGCLPDDELSGGSAHSDDNGRALTVAVPTGLGKTACLDVAVWALAGQAARPPGERTLPTRSWYVVNRRLLVDAAYGHGLKLSRWLKEPDLLRVDWEGAASEHVDRVAEVGRALEQLGALGSDHGPLHVSRLRGGADLGARSPDPSQPALLFATVPMFASRWLFRGFGSSRSMRPVDAALAGIDSLVLLDEAHLARPLMGLAGPLAQCDAGDPAGVLMPADRARPCFVALTATSDDTGERFDLDDDDRAHPVVQQRLHATKRGYLHESTGKALNTDLAQRAVDVVGQSAVPTSCVVFANTAAAARDVFDQVNSLVTKQKVDVEQILVTGRMRDREAAACRDLLLDTERGVPSGRERRGRERHLVVVATQTLEVGADLDFDHLVTETTGTRALIQRLGRLNRLGLAESSTATVIHPVGTDEWPVYGSEPAAVWARLQEAHEAANARGDHLDLGPAQVGEVLGEPDDAPQPGPELLPHHVAAWAQTSMRLGPFETPPELFYDRQERDRRVSVLWRAYVPGTSEDADVAVAAGVDVEAAVDGEVDVDGADVERPDGAGAMLVPPVKGEEAIDLPVSEFHKALKKRGVAYVHCLAVDGATLELVAVDDVRSGHQVVLPAGRGFYDESGWNPAAKGPVFDVAFARGGLVLTTEVVENLFAPPEAPSVGDTVAAEADDSTEPSDAEAVGEGAGRRATGSLGTALGDLRGQRPDEDEDEDEDEAGWAEAREADLAAVVEELQRRGPRAELRETERKAWDDWVRAWTSAVESDGIDCLEWLPDGAPTVVVSPPQATGRRQERADVRSDAFDELSFVDPDVADGEAIPSLGLQAEDGWEGCIADETSPLLARHQCTVGLAGAKVARHLGLPGDLVEAVRRAGNSHDLGKLDVRFQRWLNPFPGGDDEPLAKSGTPRERRELYRRQAGWPRGGRHELLSARLLDEALAADTPQRDLILHLVASHHGHGRPDIQVVDDAMPAKLHAEVAGQQVTVPSDLSLPDWGQPGRFARLCQLYGYWGVALLEAVVRQADHAASARSEVT